MALNLTHTLFLVVLISFSSLTWAQEALVPGVGSREYYPFDGQIKGPLFQRAAAACEALKSGKQAVFKDEKSAVESINDGVGCYTEKLLYKSTKLFVAFCSFTSGIATTLPFVFIHEGDGWQLVECTRFCKCDMTARIEGDELVFTDEWPNTRLNLAKLVQRHNQTPLHEPRPSRDGK